MKLPLIVLTPPTGCFRGRLAFTLIELLTVIAVIAILASLIIAGVGKVRTTVMKSQGSSNMRQIGAAVLMYSNEHGGYLPGPSGLGLVPYFRNPGETNLSVFIAPYLDVPLDTPRGENGVVMVPAMVCPGAEAVLDQEEGELPPPYYVQSYDLDIPRGRIFGAQEYGNSEATTGWMLTRIEELGSPASTWMLTNLDQQLPTDMPTSRSGSVTASGWFSRLPEKPVWGDTRMRLYLDGHVAEVPRDAEY